MRKSTLVTLGDREVHVNELTMRQLDECISSMPIASPMSMLDHILDDHLMSGPLLSAATGVSVDDLTGMAPSEVQPLALAFRKVNPDFMTAAARITGRQPVNVEETRG